MSTIRLPSSQTPQWQCISGCGACCRLDPTQRMGALEHLSEPQRRLYLSMVGQDGWCIHFDTGGRRCRIYDDRPDFCRVTNLLELFGRGACLPGQTTEPEENPSPQSSASPSEDFDSLAIACCTQQIRCEYGGRGRVMRRFLRAIRRRP